MRKFLLMIPLVLVSFAAFAQAELNNFKIQDKTIVWQKVFEFPVEDSVKVANFFYNNANFSYEDNMGVCYYRLGYETSIKPAQLHLLLKSYSRVKFVVQIKDSRYRVTVQSVESEDIFIRTNAGKALKDKVYLPNSLSESYFKKDGSLRQSFFSLAPQLNEALENVFYYNKGAISVLDDDF